MSDETTMQVNEMARRGPSPKPTALKKLLGNPGRRPLPETEPDLPVGAPTMPKGLSKAAAAEWRRVVPLLVEYGLVAKADTMVLAGMCETWAVFVEARDAKLADRQLKAAAELRRFGQEFGMSPASRTRIRMEIATAKVAVPADEQFLSSPPPLRVVK